MYKYHCQHQAESFAAAIIAVPKNYPLKKGLPENYCKQFAKLCAFAKKIYLDMAESPEKYGLMLVDIESKDHNLARDGYRTIHRFVDTLSALCFSGKLKNHKLTVSAETFNKEIKKGRGAVSGPVPKYELILSRLVESGFAITPFDGKPFGKKTDSFEVSFPKNPEMIDTINIYCECWDKLKSDRSSIKMLPKEFHHHYYRFDYKITADCENIPIKQWLKDEADYLGYSPELKTFALEFYEMSLNYKDIKFDGEYYLKLKRIARITQTGYIAMNNKVFKLALKISEPDKCMAVIEKLPEALQKYFARDYCRHCSFQGATEKYCKFRIQWTFKSKPHTGCVHACFNFSDFENVDAEIFWEILELQYGLKEAGK